jgi:hypothetical protein
LVLVAETIRLPDLEVGRVEPEVGPLAGQRALEEVAHPLVDVLGSSFETALWRCR